MENLHQIDVIYKALNKEKKGYLAELGRVTTLINKKKMSIQKVIAYQKDYDSNDKLKQSHAIPALARNLLAFNEKLNNMIKQEEIEIERIENGKKSIMLKINEIEKKMKLMEHFQDRVLQKRIIREEWLEQATLDDLTANKPLRGDYD